MERNDVSRTMIRVLACGGRYYSNKEQVFWALDAVAATFGGIAEIIHGGATGADTLAGKWAALRGVPERVFHADWGHGRIAGPVRNHRMLDEGKPDVVVAFPGGRGTAHMVRIAKAARVNVLEAALIRGHDGR